MRTTQRPTARAVSFCDPDPPFCVSRRWSRQWTSHGLSSAFLGFQAGVEQRVVFEHGAGDIEKTVADGAQCTGMGTAASFQSDILGFALLIAPPRGVRQVVNGVPQSWIAGEPSSNGA